MCKGKRRKFIVGPSRHWFWTRGGWRGIFVLRKWKNVFYRPQWNKTWNSFQLNSNFDVSSKTLTLSNSTLFSADNTASRILKVGPRTRIAIIRAANFNAVSAGGTYQVGTLDEEDRPVAETCAVITRTDGNTNNMFVINLQTDGRVSIRPLTQCSAGVTCIGTISWPTSA